MVTPTVYGREHVALLSADEMAARDRAARERRGIPERVLMESAGRAAALVLGRLFPRGRVVGVLGSGNNGGDGLVLLRTLASWGREVAYVSVGSSPPEPVLTHGRGLPEIDLDDAESAFARAGVLVDGILGTGATGAPREPAASVLGAMNASGRPILALDVPSGVDPTTGDVPAVAACAAATVAFGWPKRGLLLQPGRARCGRILAAEIGFPPEDTFERAPAALLTPDWAAARLPTRPPAAHKGTAGRLLALAGSRGMAGAAVMAGEAAVRSGAGMVHLASAAANRGVLQSTLPEAVFTDRADADGLERAADAADALLAGPGLGTGGDTRRALDAALEHTTGRPTLLDADALTLLAADEGALERVADDRPLVCTPHPGEMRRLTGEPTEDIAAAPLESASGLAERLGCVVLLKGAPSVVAAPGEPMLVNTVGSSDLATAGMGDTLAGVIGAFLAGGVPAREAAALGLFYSGRAADLAARGRSLTPGDLVWTMNRAFAAPGAERAPLGLPFITFDQRPRR